MNPSGPDNSPAQFPNGGFGDSSGQAYNPYASTMPGTPGEYVMQPGDAGMVGHMQVVSILQIVFGVLELMMGGLLAFYAIMMNVMGAEVMNAPKAPPQEAIFWIGLGLALAAVVVLMFAILRISSGIRSLWFQGRTMMLISLIGGMVTMFTCYCAPFSVGVGIYGLIVLLNPSVKQAFKMAEDGLSAEQIRAHFARARYGF